MLRLFLSSKSSNEAASNFLELKVHLQSLYMAALHRIYLLDVEFKTFASLFLITTTIWYKAL